MNSRIPRERILPRWQTFKAEISFDLSIGVEKTAVHVGGMNLFGKDFGDFPQDIIFRYIY